MPAGARTAVTLAGVSLLLVLAAIWGWSAATDPLPGKVDTPICVTRSVEAGSKVFPQDVTVSVYNASNREGLAGRTMQLFTGEGFAQGNSGNVSARVGRAQIWTTDPDSPAVRLVASRLGRKVRIERREATGAGVTVVVGEKFKKLAKGKKSVVADQDGEICSPPVG